MERMESTGKQGMMTKLRNRKGFSLVEMAIVLVIIGIIIAAIVKGQDLMVNANAKKVISATQTWRVLALAYMDRNGRLPGDPSKNGIIGDPAASATPFAGYTGASVTSETTDPKASAITEIKSVMTNAPTNPIIAGGMTVYAYFGNVPGLPSSGIPRNIISLCKTADCTGFFTKDDREILKAMDTALDGEANAGIGQFRSNKEAVTDPSTSLTALIPTYNNYSSTGNAANTWDKSDIVAAVWAFDAPF